MSLKDDVRKKLGKPRGEKDSVEGILLDGNLPSSVKPTDTDSKPLELHPPPDNIFKQIADNTDFQRFIVWVVKQIDPMFKGVTTRDNTQMLTQINERAEIATEIYRLKRGTHEDFRNVIKELKEVLKERREKVE